MTTRPKPQLKDWVELYPYQKKAIEWMRTREKQNPKHHHGVTGGLLCLQMGLGKTLTSLEHSLSSQQHHNEHFPTLIIASKTVMYEWKNQGTEKFYDNCRVLYLHRDFIGNNIKHITGAEIMHYNLVITTYDQCLSSSRKHEAHKYVCEYGQEGLHKDKVIAIHKRTKPQFAPKCTGDVNIFRIPWTRVICDESQRFSNPSTYTFKAVMAIYATYRWCLTGTPLRNYDTDIWSQLRFCGYDTITTSKLWRYRFFRDHALNEYVYEANYVNTNVQLPEQIIHNHVVEMDREQKLTYQALLLTTQNLYEQMLGKFVSYACVLAIFLRLRQVSIAPYLIVACRKANKNALIKNLVEQALTSTKVDKWIVDDEGSAGIDSPKIKKIIEIIEQIPSGEKIILFSMFTTCLQLVTKAIQIDLPNHRYEYLVGTTTGSQRINILKNFKENKNITILLVHYKVGGEGLNLIEANHVICIEPWWSPAVHNQGIARCWRRGQEKPVHIHWVISKDSIEQSIMNMCYNKNQLLNHYLYNVDYEPIDTGLTKYELCQLLQMTATN